MLIFRLANELDQVVANLHAISLYRIALSIMLAIIFGLNAALTIC